MNNGRVARTAGLVITTAVSAAAIQNTVWSAETKFALTVVIIALGALFAAIASDYDMGK